MAGIRCHRCGRTGEPHALDWSSTVRAGATEPLCGPCTRHHVRDIESKLEERWWAPGMQPVVVVEDDADIRLLIRLALESAGYAVDEVGTGEDALQLLDSGLHPAVMVVEVGLPGAVDGWSVRERVRSLPGVVPVIMIRPDTMTEPADAATDVDILRKPFDMDLLVALVDRRSTDQAGAGLA